MLARVIGLYRGCGAEEESSEVSGVVEEEEKETKKRKKPLVSSCFALSAS
jgi:hypothetical protein